MSKIITQSKSEELEARLNLTSYFDIIDEAIRLSKRGRSYLDIKSFSYDPNRLATYKQYYATISFNLGSFGNENGYIAKTATLNDLVITADEFEKDIFNEQVSCRVCTMQEFINRMSSLTTRFHNIYVDNTSLLMLDTKYDFNNNIYKLSTDDADQTFIFLR